MSYQVNEEMDAHLRELSCGLEGWGHGYLTGGLVAFALVAWAEAIRQRHVCGACDGTGWGQEPVRCYRCWGSGEVEWCGHTRQTSAVVACGETEWTCQDCQRQRRNGPVVNDE